MDYWIFTFGCSRDVYGDMAGKAVKVYAKTYNEARIKMIGRYGTKWAFQYSKKDWNYYTSEHGKLEEIVGVIE